MEIKRNKPTLNRPDVDRVLDAPFVFLDIPLFLKQLKKEKTWKQSDRNAITIFKSDNVTIVISILKKGAKISNTESEEFLSAQVLEGEAEISTIEGEFTATKKQAVTFHPGIHYSVTAMSETTLLITSINMNKEF